MPIVTKNTLMINIMPNTKALDGTQMLQIYTLVHYVVNANEVRLMPSLGSLKMNYACW